MANLRIQLFGAPEVLLDGQPVTFDTRKALALIAYLAVTGRSHRRERLAALLWPESEQPKARAALRRTLSVTGAIGSALIIERGEIGLDRASVWCDVTAFEALVGSENPDDLRQAIALAPDQFLAGFTLRDSVEFDDWTASTTERLRDRLSSALARLTEAEVGRGRLAEALDAAQNWASIDPLSEAAHRQLMRLFVWTNQRPAALRQFRTCVRALDRELGVAPLPETTQLYDDIRANRLAPRDETAVPKKTAPDSVEALQQATEIASDSESPVVLVGREEELNLLLDRWRRSARTGGAVTLIGSPGLGRTALSAALANEVSTLGGAVISIRGHAAESRLAFAAIVDLVQSLQTRDPALAEPLAFVGEPVESSGELVRLFETVRSAVAQALLGPVPGLLVVDDAHWFDPTSAELLQYLIRRPPTGVLILVTWRGDAPAPVDRADSPDIVSLRPWNAGEVGAALERLDRAELDAGEAHRRTGGIPRLVVEYAMASTFDDSTRSVELHDLVGARLHAAPEATRQLLGTAAILGSVSDPQLLRQTSGRDEAEIVDAIEDAVARGLLVEDAQRFGYDVPYDALREIILERISLARVRLLHGRAAEVLARRNAQDPTGAPAAVVALHLASAGREDEASEWFWQAATNSFLLYAHREALDHLKSALALGFDPARVHASSGDALTRLGRYSEALVAYEQSAAAVPVDDLAALAVIEHKLAEVHDRIGDWAVAQAHLESASDLLTSKGDNGMRAQVTADLALVLHRQGQANAESTGLEALGLAETSGDERALAQAHNVLGVLAAGKGELDKAAKHLTVSFDYSKGVPDLELGVAALNNLARLHTQAGRIDEALASAQQALDLGIQHGDLHRVAALNDHVADLLHQAGRDAEAMPYLKAAASAFANVDHAQVRPEVWKLVAW
ncbi:MAG TPA: BTAD domain-containing putative transcriptional regulator [Actinomycetes bacterium]|nr:BTAD domain-containing putative transcriptional regulator [Actinomycetes bacterium]